MKRTDSEIQIFEKSLFGSNINCMLLLMIRIDVACLIELDTELGQSHWGSTLRKIFNLNFLMQLLFKFVTLWQLILIKLDVH
jgi:hypothetical protein